MRDGFLPALVLRTCPHRSRPRIAVNIRAVTEDGRVVLEDEISWEELQDVDFKIVIGESAQGD